MSEALEGLAARAHATRAAVVGGGIAGLVAALELAKVGMSVTVFEAEERPGGVLRHAEVAGIGFDTGAESYATRGGHVRALIDELDVGGRVVTPSAGGAWVAGIPGTGAAPLPRGGVIGIPDNVWDPAVRRVIGWRGAWRAWLDRLRPPLTIGHDRSLGHLVRSRMGARVLDRLVAPVTTGVYSAEPDDIDTDAAAPGLNAALTRAGSLSGAVGELRAAGTRATASSDGVPGSAVASLEGGMATLVDALCERLRMLGVEVRSATRVEAVSREDGCWRLDLEGPANTGTERDAPDDATEHADGEVAAEALGGAAADPRAAADHATPDDPATPAPTTFDADVLVVAAPEAAARRLLASVVPGLAPEVEAGPALEIVTLVVDAPELDTPPRGTGVLTVPHAYPAKALTHVTAKWAWLRARAGEGVHVVRVSFGMQGERPATAELDDAAAASFALAQASVLLGVPLPPERLRGAHRERYVQAQPASVLGRADLVAAARTALHRVPHLAAVGAWLSGTGLAQVVPDAITEAERMRRQALWQAD